MSEPRDVVVPAGGVISAEYARAIGSPHRALAPVGPGRTPVLQIVVDALRASGVVRQIIGVTAEPVAQKVSGVDVWLPAGDSGPENILRGLAALPTPDAPALVCTSDLPLLTPDAVRAFVAHCDAEAEVTLGLVTAAAYEEAFPGAPPSEWVHLRDAGPVTLGGLFGIRPALLQRNTLLLADAMAARKSQFGMVRLLGPRLVWQWATRSLTLAALTARGETLLGCRTQILRDAAPALALDIDTEDDYTDADARLQTQQRPADTAHPHPVRL